MTRSPSSHRALKRLHLPLKGGGRAGVVFAFLFSILNAPAFAAALEGEAFKAADAAYAAIARNDLAEAETQARAAVALRPDSTDAVRLLMDVLNRRGNAAEARAVADAAIARGTVDADLRAARGFLLAADKQYDAAIADFTAALQAPNLEPARARVLRLSLADAAAGAGNTEAVLAALAPLAAEQSYDVQARIGFAAFTLERFDQAAAAFRIASETAATPAEWTTAMKGRAQAEAGLNRPAEVIVIVQALLDRDETCDLDLAYVLLRVGEDARALSIFEGRCKDAMTASAHLDAGYAARRLDRNAQAAAHFKAALDAGRAQNNAGTPPAFDALTEFGIKRGIDSLERQWGLSAGAFYRGDRSAAGGGSVGQGLVEAYWQPPVIGNRDGKLFQVYGRVGLNALTPSSAVQTDSTQGAVGLRYKPFSELNLLVAGERLFPIGDSAMSDWLLRAGTSFGFNTDIQPDKTTYWTGQIYGEAAYFVDQERFIGSVEGRYGVDTRLGSSPNLLGSLYASAAANYDSAETRKSVAAVGAGLGLRYWFRETQYRAASSFIQFDVMYRFKLGPSDRAAGLVLQTSLSF